MNTPPDESTDVELILLADLIEIFEQAGLNKDVARRVLIYLLERYGSGE